MILDEKDIIPVLIDCPKDISMSPYLEVTDIIEKLPSALNIEYLPFHHISYHDEIYLAYLNRALSQIPNLNTSELLSDIPSLLNHLEEAEKDMIIDMFMNGMQYRDIIHTMTISPSVQSKLESSNSDTQNITDVNAPFLRWATSAFIVSSVINPMLSQDELRYAKPVNSLFNPTTSDEYISFLHTVLLKNPTLKLNEANKVIIKILTSKNFQYDNGRMENLLAYSPDYRSSLDNIDFKYGDDVTKGYAEKLKVLNSISDLINDTISSDLNPMDYLSPKKFATSAIAEVETSNDVILNKMRSSLQELKQRQDSSNALDYWIGTLHIIEKTLAELQLDKKQAVCETLKTWSEVIASASEKMDIETSPEVMAIHDKAEEFREKAELEENDWKNLFNMIQSVEDFTKTMISATTDKIKTHPLMQNPLVYNAVPYNTLIKTQKHTPEKIYCSLLRKAVLDNPQVGIHEADIIVKDLLDTFKLNTKQKILILAHSPRYNNLPQKTKEAEVSRWLATVTLQSTSSQART